MFPKNERRGHGKKSHPDDSTRFGFEPCFKLPCHSTRTATAVVTIFGYGVDLMPCHHFIIADDVYAGTSDAHFRIHPLDQLQFRSYFFIYSSTTKFPTKQLSHETFFSHVIFLSISYRLVLLLLVGASSHAGRSVFS